MHIPSHSVHTAAHCNPLQPKAKHPVHIQCTHCSIHYIFSAHTAAAIISSVHTLQQPLHLQCTHCSIHYIFSAHTAAAITSSVHTSAMYSHVQLSAANLQCTLQPTATIYNHLHCSYSIQCTLQLYYPVHTAAILSSAHCSYTIYTVHPVHL